MKCFGSSRGEEGCNVPGRRDALLQVTVEPSVGFGCKMTALNCLN